MRAEVEVHFDRQIDTFNHYTEPFLVQEEARNNLLLGLCSNLKAGLTASSIPPLLIRIMHRQKVLAAALQTPPNPLVLTRASKEELDLLAAALLSRNLSIPSVVGPPDEARYFADQWCHSHSLKAVLAMKQGIYQLTQVIQPPPVPGRMRVAHHAELSLVAQWMYEFNDEAMPQDPKSKVETLKKVEQIIQRQALFVWEQNGRPVSMAGSWGTTPNGVRINAVYTPADLRRRGIASRLVAELSQAKLKAGNKFCFLYTDLSNPTSNRIYQKIGYGFVCESKYFVFTKV
ncbi:MAG TPA: hypothetical protein DCS07_14235 [Bdellovibrionales bacterium]|nr:MAG: hypothetical protein A2Z97_14355 [Bdellovibrionales bacterium GWB1_52_6]OFZ06204.1 MAG: hypothetical protein A2X97_09125 [Bdellovibrionales bacterium GWA1_52_35]OFZ38002.1 MAG: hypothetical protein A2070_00405 [Bdellovibrionales bacterium GWC1_52_8]HAR43770.1 hypothetical protein [Bdellovibrionales bacterium]HCM41153.1 hypothetical protein [Bdellovibrionales bacterium]